MSDVTGADVPAAPLDYIESPSPRRPRRALAAGGVAVALLVGVLAVVAANRGGGEDTPEGAVRRLADAVAAEDVLGVLDALAPAERTVLGPRVAKLVSELGRLGILDDGLDLSRVPGGDITFDALQLQSEPLADGLASVLVTGGSAALAVAADALPLGPLTRPLMDSGGGVPSPPPAELGGSDVRLVAVRDDGRWYVSVGWLLDAGRRDTGEPFPDPAKGVEPKGEASPEAAVEAMVRAGVAGDFRRMVELTAPGEAAPLHAFAPLFLPAAPEAVGEVRELEVRADRSGDEARVTFDKLLLQFDGIRVEKDADCVRWVFEIPIDVIDDSVTPPDDYLRRCIAADAVAATVQRDGAWYVSPAGTALDTVLSSLASISREEVAEAVEEQGGYGLFEVFDDTLLGFLGVSDPAMYDGDSERICVGEAVPVGEEEQFNSPDCVPSAPPPVRVPAPQPSSAPVPAPLPTAPGEPPPVATTAPAPQDIVGDPPRTTTP